jgi:hypothetical protein
VDLDQPRITLPFTLPHTLQQGLALKHPARVAGQHREQVELRARHGHLSGGDPHLPSIQVNLEITHPGDIGHLSPAIRGSATRLGVIC